MNGTFEGPSCVTGRCPRLPERSHDTIAYELVYHSPVGKYLLRDELAVLRQQLGDLLRGHGLAKPSKGAQVDKHDGNAPATKRKRGSGSFEFGEHTWRKEPAEI